MCLANSALSAFKAASTRSAMTLSASSCEVVFGGPVAHAATPHNTATATPAYDTRLITRDTLLASSFLSMRCIPHPAPPHGGRAATAARPGHPLTPTGDRALTLLELEVQARRDALRTAATPRRGTGAAVVDERRMRGIVAVGLDPVAAGADVVVRVDVIDRQGVVNVPGQLLVELVPVGGRVHVRRVLADSVRVEVVLATRVANRRTGMRPTGRNAVRAARELVLEGRPLPVALPLV